MSDERLLLHRATRSPEFATQMLNEHGTTDVAIGDATAEIMITTPGKIPNEMFELDDTTPIGKVLNPGTDTQGFTSRETSNYVYTTLTSTEGSKLNNVITGHSTILLILLIALLIILLLCCVTACVIARSKRRSSFFGKSDMECEPGCSGINQPLLDKISDVSNKTSCSSTRN